MKLTELTIADLKALLDYLTSVQDMFIELNNDKEVESAEWRIIKIKNELTFRLNNINF